MSSDVLPASMSSRRWLAPLGYAAMIAFAVAAFFLIRAVGEGLDAPEPAADAPAVKRSAVGRVDVVQHVLATLAAVIVLGRILGWVLRRLGQPPVIGEVVAGIVLGPSLLGAISPEAMHLLIPSAAEDPRKQVAAALKAIAQLGVVLYMFLVGLELNTSALRAKVHSTVAISHASIVAPFVLGAALAIWLYPILSNNSVPFTSFALFMGSALSVTAFPVLVRILEDSKLDKTATGSIALGCAAVDDVTAWCLLALVVGVAQAEVNDALLVCLMAIGYIALMFALVRPAAARITQRWDQTGTPASAVPAVLAAVLLSALASQAIGIHAIFGGFLLGVMIPHEAGIAQDLIRKLKDLVAILLLPAFFALTGLNTSIGLIDGWQNWLICGVVIVVATLGKFGGCYATARITGLDRRTSAALGAMMNTRGLMGLIVLDIGFQMGVISETLFAMMVIMALVTTMMTAPLLKRLLPENP